MTESLLRYSSTVLCSWLKAIESTIACPMRYIDAAMHDSTHLQSAAHVSHKFTNHMLHRDSIVADIRQYRQCKRILTYQCFAYAMTHYLLSTMFACTGTRAESWWPVADSPRRLQRYCIRYTHWCARLC
jgi:hypothetical protein